MKILILCTGNSCRSQIAQGFLQSFDSDLTVCSAGTEPSEKVNDKAVAVMNEVGIDISSAYPKSVNQYLDEEWDYGVICKSPWIKVDMVALFLPQDVAQL